MPKMPYTEGSKHKLKKKAMGSSYGTTIEGLRKKKAKGLISDEEFERMRKRLGKYHKK